MNFSQLRYLQLIVLKGSFAAAADAAGVSQPAVTQAMRALEDEWGIRLFEKVGRQKLPTRAALAFAQQAADFQRQFDRLTQSRPDDGSAHPAAQTLRVGMAPAAALLYSGTMEHIWRSQQPEGLLQVVSGSAPELLAALAQGDLDLVAAPRPRRFQAEGIEQHPLHVSLPTVYARRGHPLASATSLQDIQHAGWAVSGRGGTAGNVIEEAHRVRQLPEPRILVQCADYLTLLELVAQTDLLCVVPHPALVQDRHHVAVQALQVREGLPQYEVCLFWVARTGARNGAVIDAVVRALRDREDAPGTR